MTPVLTFKEDGHKHYLDNVQLPGVTDVIAALGFNPPYANGPARVRGTQVHKACQYLDQGMFETHDVELGPDIVPYLQSYKGLLKDHPFEYFPDAIEKQMYDPALLVAGIMDRAGMLWGRPFVLDFKSGAVSDSVGLQTAAYARMYFGPKEVWKVRRFGVALLKDGRPAKPVEFTDPCDYEAWEATVKIYNWKARKGARIAA